MKTLVVIPAYNEATTIASLLGQMKGDYATVVIDDGSRDNTGEIARTFSVPVVRHIINRGLGAALRTGFAYAIHHGFDAVVTLDADGQHNPEEIPGLLEALTEADVVIGTRRESDMPRIRRIYNRLGAYLTSGLFGGQLRDSQSGFRAFRVTALEKCAFKTSRMEISSEIIAEAHRLNLRIAEAPITVRYTEYSMSKGQGFVEGVRTAWRLLLKSLS